MWTPAVKFLAGADMQDRGKGNIANGEINRTRSMLLEDTAVLPPTLNNHK